MPDSRMTEAIPGYGVKNAPESELSIPRRPRRI
jgi:hypothetical protein